MGSRLQQVASGGRPSCDQAVGIPVSGHRARFVTRWGVRSGGSGGGLLTEGGPMLATTWRLAVVGWVVAARLTMVATHRRWRPFRPWYSRSGGGRRPIIGDAFLGWALPHM